MKKIIFFAFLIQLIGCDVYIKKLELVNNSKKTIYFKMLLDTTLSDYIPLSAISSISPNQYLRPAIGNGKGDHYWENTINEHSIDSSLHIYFFDTSAINENIVIERRYKRFDLKVKDLDSINWRVVYE